MFAVLSSEEMQPFYDICASFPTVIFFVCVLFCFLYWLLAIVGFLAIDAIDMDIPEVDADMDMGSVGFAPGVMLKLGLNGVPLMVVISLIAMIGWLLSFLAVYYLVPYVPGSIFVFFAKVGIFLAALYVSAYLTSLIIKPLRPILKTLDQEVKVEIVGRIATVRTGRVDENFGEGFICDGGAGLIIKIRTLNKEDSFKKGDRVAVIEKTENDNVYRVISEAEFTQKI